MRELVLDASVVLKWSSPRPERHRAAALELLRDYVDGRLAVLAPRLLGLEVMNVSGRAWRWRDARLVAVAEELARLRFRIVEPELVDVARWIGAGLTAYDAAYVAVAEAAGVELVTDDAQLVAAAPSIARRLAAAA